MARFFLHLRDHIDEVLDPDGVELVDMAAVRTTVLANARDVMSGSLTCDGLIDFRYRIDAENTAGEIAYSLAFRDAVQIVG